MSGTRLSIENAVSTRSSRFANRNRRKREARVPSSGSSRKSPCEKDLACILRNDESPEVSMSRRPWLYEVLEAV
ncbi:hypothetical protein BAUCODRAFT_123182 [Baudoinia panamericana UAMH 10762]|uniref:Uncharacterized protein n=1 Tax=Baudoinia panamericana (strain UAMH 10762) TaxID=717646 RepID=M2LNG3_BAUPA|nr:uncharacterized protein BAUCODRAFT_123182 [Baudoinia panamericana UAMH 10762]EMC95892.1 hypothetical protein BAUCODRAFT_123182 [Baudoinia panamericana UAMH 10762]